MLFIASDGTIINTEPTNQYFHNSLKIRNLWFSNEQNFKIHTSGSTGIPKEISITRNQILASVSLTKNAFQLESGDTAFCCLNIETIAGFMMLIRAFEIGMDLIVVEPSSNPLDKLGNQKYLLESSRGKNFFAFVPLQLENIVSNPILNSAKAIIVGGASIHSELLEKVQNINSPIYATYGMTETITHIAIRRLNGIDQSKYFQTLNGVLIEIDNRNCLKIKSETTNNQWITTNDIINLIDTNHFEILGRIDNIINSGGIKIQLEKVENIIVEELKKMQFDERAFCYGIDDNKFGKKLILVLENTQQIINFSELKDKLKEKLSKFEIPKEVYFVEKFIETNSGKIDKINTVKKHVLTQISNG